LKKILLVDITEFDGWELRAAWDDFKIGLKYGFDFDKIAIYGKNRWIEYGVKITSWFMGGEIKEFDNIEDAISWLNS
jgi:predicted Co/Zn/Cd cation transporter (cation efflux family)